jgi:superkiller protein 3
MLRRFDDAKKSAQKAIELNGNDAEAWYMLWRASDDWNDVNSPSIQKAITISPYLPVANLQLGNQYMDQKNYEKSEEFYKRALTGNDEFELAWANLGNLYFTMKRYDDAVAALKRAIELKPQYAYALYTLGLVYWYQEKWQDVVNAWEECLKVDPNHDQAKQWLPKAKEKLTGK